MKFLISVIDDLGKPGTREEFVNIDAFNDKLQAEGHWIFAGGLAAPVNATVIDNRDHVGLLQVIRNPTLAHAVTQILSR